MRTKIIISLLFVTFLGSSQSLFAQSPIHVGIKAGANFTDMSTNLKDYSTKAATGFSGGATIRVDIKKSYLQADIMYATKNTKFESPTLSSSTAKWNSLEVPLVFGHKIIDLTAFNLRAFAGGVYTKVISDDIRFSDVKEVFHDFNKDNIGYRVGLGVDVLNFSLDVSYDGAIQNLSNSYESKPKSITATLGFFFL